MATVGLEGIVKIWDLRKYQSVDHYPVSNIPVDLTISQSNILAVATQHKIILYKDWKTQK